METSILSWGLPELFTYASYVHSMVLLEEWGNTTPRKIPESVLHT